MNPPTSFALIDRFAASRRPSEIEATLRMSDDLADFVRRLEPVLKGTPGVPFALSQLSHEARVLVDRLNARGLPPGGMSPWRVISKLVPGSRETLRQAEHKGEFPKRVRLGERCSMWHNDEIEAWLADPTGWANRNNKA